MNDTIPAVASDNIMNPIVASENPSTIGSFEDHELIARRVFTVEQRITNIENLIAKLSAHVQELKDSTMPSNTAKTGGTIYKDGYPIHQNTPAPKPTATKKPTTAEVKALYTKLMDLKMGQDPDFYYEELDAIKRKNPELYKAYIAYEEKMNATATAPAKTATAQVPAATSTAVNSALGVPAEQAEMTYLTYAQIEAEMKELAPSIVFRSESDFNPEINPTGRISKLPTDAAVIPPNYLIRLVEPSKEWDSFAGILNMYATTVWRDPRDRDGSNVDYIINMLHPEGLFFIRIRAVET